MKPALSTMIRVGSSTSGVSTILNDFHSKTAPSTSGFYCNTSGSVNPPPSELLKVPRMAFELAVPPFPASIKDKNFFIWRNPFIIGSDEYSLPLTVSNTYLAVTKVSGGFQVARFSAYSGEATAEVPSKFELSLSHGLLTNDVTYIRVGDVLPFPTQFTWLSSASGTNPRIIVGYQSSIIRSPSSYGTNFRTSCDGTGLYKFELVYGSADLSVLNDIAESINVNATLNTWSGSGLGGSTFSIIIFLESCP